MSVLILSTVAQPEEQAVQQIHNKMKQWTVRALPLRYSALHPSGVTKLSTSFSWGKGGNVTSAGWQVTLCDPMWHVSSRSGVATLRTAIHLLHVT